MAKKVRIGLIGPHGKMGVAITEIIKLEFNDRVEITTVFGRETANDFAKHLSQIDVFLDVSTPAATERFLKELCKQDSHIPYVIGCTGWSEDQLKSVHAYRDRACVVFAPNFSLGVNLFLGLIEQAAPLLAKWGYDVTIHETHHTRKLDVPSGTAKAIIERLEQMNPQVHSTRAGNIVGTHEVRFIGPNDILSLTHEALDRSIFARGAVLAADWASHPRAMGLYSMKEVVFGSD